MGIFDDKPGSIFGNDPDGGLLNRKKTDKPDFSDTTSGASGTGETSRPADFSDVTSGSSSTAQTGGRQTYTVKSGDSLSKIAKHIYGDANKWHVIYEANRDKIKNPDLIHPGQEFTIPDA